MRYTIKLIEAMRSIAIIAFAVVIGFSMAACGDDPGDDPGPGPGTDPFKGTWISADVKWIAANGSWKQYTIPENTEVIRGTYTYSGNTVTGKVVSVNTVMFDGEDTWVTYANLSDEYKGYMSGDTYIFTIANKTFSLLGWTFVVPPDFNGSWSHTAEIPDNVTITNVISGSDVTIKMEGDDFQKGTFAFSSKRIYMKVTHEWENGAWETVDWDEDITFEYVLNGSTLTLSNGLVDGDPPSGEKGKNMPLFEGTWTRQ
ncbi:MAG: hypothetical protein LBI28_11885 [Treponema sp.]|jgi:uncharacterized lipoprotein YehR (DUF1307 family)|nr:hypothetical protein [Treponema sp.]